MTKRRPAKQLTAQFYKEIESAPNKVTSELLSDLLKFNPTFKIPNNLTVNGNLDLYNIEITSLPDNLTVNGYLYLRNTPITSLPDNLTVKGDLYLSNTPMAKNKELLTKYKKKYKIE